MLTNSMRILLRRWPLLVAALVLGVLSAGGVFAVVPATHKATGSVLFVPSLRQPGVEGPTNPLLSLTGSVAVVASVLQIAVTDEETQLKLADEGQTAKYEVVPDLSENAGPILLVTAEDSTSAMALSARDAIVKELSASLDSLQTARRIPADLHVTAVLLTSDPKTEVIHKKQIQASVAGGGLVASAVLLLVLVRERRRSDADRETGSDYAGRRRHLENDDTSAEPPDADAGTDEWPRATRRDFDAVDPDELTRDRPQDHDPRQPAHSQR